MTKPIITPTKDEEFENNLKWKSYVTGISISDIREKTFDNFDLNEDNKIAFDMMKNWSPDKEFGIMFYGSCGTGKTHLLKALAISLVSSHYRVCFQSLSSIFESLRANWEDVTNLSAKYKLVDLLMIDDFGAEKSTEFSEDILFQILDYRINHRKKTFATSNLLPKEILSKYHPRIFDRLNDLMILVPLNGDSHRIKKQNRYMQMISEKGYPQ